MAEKTDKKKAPAKGPKRTKVGLPDDVRALLAAPMPPESISAHPSKSYLSTIKAIYVVERLNDVFGVCGWSLVTRIVKETEKYLVVAGFISIPEFNLRTPLQYGGSKLKPEELGDGFKSAVTDVQSKCASYLEVGFDVFKGKVSPPKSKAPAKAAPAKTAPAKAEAKTEKVKPLPKKLVSEIEEKAKTVDNLDELQVLFDEYPDHATNEEYRGLFNEIAKSLPKEESN